MSKFSAFCSAVRDLVDTAESLGIDIQLIQVSNVNLLRDESIRENGQHVYAVRASRDATRLTRVSLLGIPFSSPEDKT